MASFSLEKLASFFSLIPNPGIRGLIQIGILSWLLYKCLNWIQNTRAWTLLRGLIFIFGFIGVCYALNFDVLLWILGRIAPTAVVTLIIIFQKELRQALEDLGNRRFAPFADMLGGHQHNEDKFSERTINELVKASFELGRARTGALIVIEQNVRLDDIVRTGIDVDGIVTSQLLINIFEHNTPLHDGAVIVRGNRIASATCYLPLSENRNISKKLGTRHRAAVGISESTDSLTIVVSEETGFVSIAQRGALTVISEPDRLREILEALNTQQPSAQKLSRPFGFGSLFRGKDKHEKQTGG